MWNAFDAKLIAIFIISAGTFFFGLLPSFLGLGARCTRSVVLSGVLCFGGGVLLATSLVHILPETREVLEEWAEVVYCSGFFFLYFMDIVLDLASRPISNPVGTEEESLLAGEARPKYDEGAHPEPSSSRRPSEDTSTPDKWNVSNLGLLIAFSIHALLEGLVVGVQSSPNGVILLVGAVCCHKLVVAFCLGAELSAEGRPLFKVIPPISLYTVGSVMGIVIGMCLDQNEVPEMNLAVSSLQALAGGTLLYVVLSEILPRERARDLPKLSILVQFSGLILGFFVMVLLNLYV